MKRYLANKDFIPISFIESQRKNGSKGDRRGLVILTVIALSLLPFVFGKEKKETVIKEDLSSQYRSLNNWLDFMDESFEGEFSKERATIIIEGQEKLSILLEKENITIDSMEELGEKKYKLQISQK